MVEPLKLYVALFRGINVGGRNRLPMKELVSLLEGFGCRNTKTYIQSGNVAFKRTSCDGVELERRIAGAVERKFGFRPQVLILTRADIDRAVRENPYPEAEAEPKSLHVGFLAAVPSKPDLRKLESIKKESERFHLNRKVFYLHAPEGIGRSKLAAATERCLGVPMTDRNWRTVCKIQEMVSELES